MSRAFAYVANTDAYIDEALISYATLRKHMPTVSVAFVTYQHLYRSTPGIMWVPLSGNYDSPIVKAEVYNAPFDDIVFLDSDTRITQDFEDIFEILKCYDVALAHEQTRGWDYDTPAPRVFCEFNTGVLAFRKSAQVARLFQDWKLIYWERRQNSNLVNDQPSFREALWSHSDVRVATLPSEFHFVASFPNYVAWRPSILHGRGNLEWIECELNKTNGPRVFIPGIGVISALKGRKSALTSIWKLIFSSVRALAGKKERSRPSNWEHLLPKAE